MTENEINIKDMIKALQCIASQDAEGDCYCDHFNANLTCEQFGDNTRLDEKHMSCGGTLKDTQCCPYSQKTYGVCYEDGELWWLKDVVSILTEIQAYRAIGTVEEFKALKEKAEPYKPQEYEDKYYGCKCGEVLLEKWEEYPKKLMPKSRGLPYCLGCGQKLDWS